MDLQGRPSLSFDKLCSDVKLIILEHVRSNDHVPLLPKRVDPRSLPTLTDLSQVSLYVDLQALCLTSRSWNHVATRRFYANIVLDIQCGNYQLPVFLRCMKAGADRHLQYSRKLSLFDMPNRGISSQSQRSHNILHDAVERDRLLLQTLQLFPSDKLRDLR